MSTEAERERRRTDQKIAALESQVETLRDCVLYLASYLDPISRRHALAGIEQKLDAELALRPR